MSQHADKKGKVFIALVGGMGPTEASEVFDVPLGTVKGWLKEIKEAQGKGGIEIRENAFITAYARFGVTTMDMFSSLAEKLQDAEYLKGKTVDDVIKHATFVRDSFQSFERMHQHNTAPALEAPAERVEAEVVEDEEL